MAVGDAAQAYDPLSSQGIDKALRTGSHAGHMIYYALTDRPQGTALDGRNAYVHRYDEQQRQLWQTYLSQQDFYYGIQSRWSDQLFWQRRRRSNEGRNPSPLHQGE
jgi:flavin-dependent dehydrogenase